jgi:acyl carrier protein
MGLEIVELLMDVEDAFDITLPEDDYARTVGGLYALVLKKLNAKKEEVCLSSVVCFRLRRAVMQHCDIKRKQFRLNTELSEVFPRPDRRRLWSEVQRTTQFSIPSLVRSRMACWLAIALWLPSGAVLAHYLKIRASFGFFLLYALAYAPAAFLLTVPLAAQFPERCRTVRDAIKMILARNYGKLSKEFQYADSDEAWGVLKRLVAEKLNVPPERVTPEARFVEDLGCN